MKATTSTFDPSEGIILYSCSLCPFAQRSRIVLLIKEIPHKVWELSNDVLIHPEQHEFPEWFKKLTPYNAVPVVCHGTDFTCYESKIVNEYLDSFNYNQVKLMPWDDEKLKAKCRMFIHDLEKQFVPSMYALMLNKDEKKDNELREKLLKELEVLERKIMQPYIMGDCISLADISLVTFVERLLYVLPEVKMFKNSFDYHLMSKQTYPKLWSWYCERMAHNKSYQQSRTLSTKHMIEAYTEYVKTHDDVPGIQ